MYSYETERSEFRPKPSPSILLLFGLVSFLFSDVVHAFLTWCIETLLAWNSGWRDVLIVDIEVLSNPASPFYVSPPLGPPWIWAGEIVSGAFLLLSVALVFFWPTRTTLASRLFVHVLAIVLLVKGVIASSLVYTGTFTTVVVRSQAVAAISILLAVALLAAVQRRLLIVLQQFWDVSELSVRATLFGTFILPGLALLGIAYWFAEFRLGTFSMIAATIVLLISQTFDSSRSGYERITSHQVTSATVALGITVLLCIAGSIWAFGSSLLEMPKKALTWSSSDGFEVKTDETIFREQLRDSDAEEDDMMIRWSSDSPEPATEEKE